MIPINSKFSAEINSANEQAKNEKRYDQLVSVSTLLATNGYYDQAIGLLVDHYEQFSFSFTYVYTIGLRYLDKNDYENAIHYFWLAHELSRNNLGCIYKLSRSLLLSCGETKIATKANFWKAIDLYRFTDAWWNNTSNPSLTEEEIYSRICVDYAKALENLSSETENVIKHYKLSLTLREDDNTRYNLSKFYLQLGNIEDSIRYFPLNEHTFYVQYLKAQILYAQGDYNGSLERVNIVIDKYKKDYALHLKFKIFVATNDYTLAYKTMKELLKSNKSSKNMIDFATFLIDGKLFTEAREVINEARKLCEKNSFDGKLAECNALSKKLIDITSSGIQEDMKLKSDLLKMYDHDQIVERLSGVITKYNEVKGYGFIEAGKDSYFFHITNCKNFKPMKEMHVTFRITIGKDDRTIAIDINPQ